MNFQVALNCIPGPTLTRAQIAGRLSLVERGTLTLAARGGLTVHVRNGCIWAAVAPDCQYSEVRAGGRYAASGGERLYLRADARSEIEIDWHAPEAERLSPGLEPLTVSD